MKSRATTRLLATRAPALTGAVFCAFLALASSSCEKQGATPDWKQAGNATAAAPATATQAVTTAATPPEAPAPEFAITPAPSTTTFTSTSPGGFRFVAYNVENWLTMDRYVGNKEVKDQPKPESEKKAVISLLAKHKPDVLGVCEIGTREDLAEIQSSLKAAGIDLPHRHYTGGTDATRHLGLLSRFPVTSTATPAETTFELKGRSFGINRGILDATLDVGGKPFRFLGVHLKSKRDVEEGDQEQMRIHEARLLRRHVDSILAGDPRARLVVYGDFNDTRKSQAFTTVTGSYRDPGYLTAIPFKDSRGHAWTHHWSYQDVYSRIDFVSVTQALKPSVDFRASYLVDDAECAEASDHRPLVAVFK